MYTFTGQNLKKKRLGQKLYDRISVEMFDADIYLLKNFNGRYQWCTDIIVHVSGQKQPFQLGLVCMNF